MQSTPQTNHSMPLFANTTFLKISLLFITLFLFLFLVVPVQAAHCTAPQVHCQLAAGAPATCTETSRACTSSSPAAIATPSAASPETQAAPAATGAQEGATQTGGTLVNPLKAANIQDLLAKILEGIVQIGSMVLVLMLVWVGFLFVFAQGNEEKIKSARQALMWTVIGGLVLLGSEAIALLIKSTVEAL